jgi:hypothetical protein
MAVRLSPDLRIMAAGRWSRQVATRLDRPRRGLPPGPPAVARVDGLQQQGELSRGAPLQVPYHGGHQPGTATQGGALAAEMP